MGVKNKTDILAIMKIEKHLQLPKQLEVGMYCFTKKKQIVRITHDDMRGYPYECFLRLATHEEIECIKKLKLVVLQT